MKPILRTLFAVYSLLAAQAFAQTLHLIGDSTLANKPAEVYPETGWGQVLGRFVVGPLQVANHAVNGRSSKSFIDEGRWDKVKAALQSGDYLLIQFGHNDQKYKDPTRFTQADGAYRSNLTRFVHEARRKGVVPVLATPIRRRSFSDLGELRDTHGPYPAAVRALAGELDVTLVDMTELTGGLLNEYGSQRSKAVFLHASPGAWSNYPEGIVDNTHLSERGALEVAQLFVLGLKLTDSSLAEYFALPEPAPASTPAPAP